MSHDRGYIALVAVLMISVMITSAVVLLGYSAWFLRSDQFDELSAESAQQSALSCIDVGIRMILSSTTPSTPYGFSIDEEYSCTIDTISIQGSILTLIVESRENSVRVRYRATVDTTIPVHIESISLF